jgi:hypothetical protein
MIVLAHAVILAGLLAWVGWTWTKHRAPFWTGLAALVPIVLGAWCVVSMAAAFSAASHVPVTLTEHEQLRQVALYEGHAYRWGMRFWGAGLISAGWLLFVMWRWETLEDSPERPRNGGP